MDYFRIEQDKSYIHAPVLDDIGSRYQRSFFTPQNASQIPDRNILFCTNPQMEYTDFLNKQICLVSKAMKEVLCLYEPFLQFKNFCILNNLSNAYENYFAPILPVKEGHFRPEDPNKLILVEGTKVEDTVFKVVNRTTEEIIIGLDLAESLLRRKLSGFTFQRIVLEYAK